MAPVGSILHTGDPHAQIAFVSASGGVDADIPQGTGIQAHLTPNTLILVQGDQTVFALGHGPHRTHRHAGCVGTLQAHHRDRNGRRSVGKNRHIDSFGLKT